MNGQREEILKVVGLKQYFKTGAGRNKFVVKAVDDISFSIYKGEVFSLVGESGCGKTTTGRSIIKLYQSTGGEVYFHGTRITSDLKAAKSHFKGVINDVKEEKQKLSAELKNKLDSGNISQEIYNQKLTEFDQDAEERIAEAREHLKRSKQDQKFERIVDQDAKDTQKNIKTHPEYLNIIEKYKKANQDDLVTISDLEAKISKAQKELNQVNTTNDKNQLSEAKNALKELTAELSKMKKEVKLNELRQKQDIKNLIYSIKYNNNLLMRKMQMIFQDPIASLNPRMTVKEIIAEGLRINGIKNEKVIDDKVKESLRVVGLVPEHASRYPHEFSGGQRQRIGIARALVVDPTFIIADEPISALDVSIRAQVINLLNDLRETQGITIMFIAHDLSVVKYFSDRLAVMYFGHIVEMGDKDKIFNNPKHPYTLSLMDSIPLPDPEYEKRRGRTVRYNPEEHHDYSKEKPTLREIEPGHLVLCNTEEFNRYQDELSKK